MPSGPKKTLISDVLNHLLDSQFVISEELGERLFKVVEGSGMGLKHSGHVMDLALANLVEGPWATSRNVQHAFGIKKLWRYSDDILFIATKRDIMRRLFFSRNEGQSKVPYYQS